MSSEREKGGRPPHEPTEEARRYTVEIMAGIGVPVEDMALAIGVSEDWLRENCSNELSAGGTRVKTRVVESMYRQALTGNVQAAQAFLKRVDDASKDTSSDRQVGKPITKLRRVK